MGSILIQARRSWRPERLVPPDPCKPCPRVTHRQAPGRWAGNRPVRQVGVAAIGAHFLVLLRCIRALPNVRTEQQPPRRDHARDARPPERAAEARDFPTAKRPFAPPILFGKMVIPSFPKKGEVRFGKLHPMAGASALLIYPKWCHSVAHQLVVSVAELDTILQDRSAAMMKWPEVMSFADIPSFGRWRYWPRRHQHRAAECTNAALSLVGRHLHIVRKVSDSLHRASCANTPNDQSSATPEQRRGPRQRN